VKIFYLPFDIKFCLKNFLKGTKAKALFLTETELWPNLILTTSSQIPIALINGRLSEKSFKRYKGIKFFIKPLLKRFEFLAVQEENYAKYFNQLGVEREKIKVVGNLKFDIFLKEIDFPELNNLPKPIILAGSTHSQEEELILKAFLEVFSQGTLIIVPRHPERFDKVEKVILSRLKENTLFIRYSSIKDTFPEFKSKRVILLFDEMGKLASLYRICDFAIIGGSFVPHGGQNPLEAIYWKKPVIVGPYMENFPFVEEFIKKKGLLQVNPENLERILKELIKNPHIAKEIAERGYEIFLKKRGALEKTLELIRNLI
ncbi:MAG: 3-deoxy-D-manno-octulosonic acid transferase, partial [Caldimicrobium sp.]